ncbi:hypothetical protein [Mycobacterium gordonae]|nr:hypothetical protein [Mycobacterium gordonae]
MNPLFHCDVAVYAAVSPPVPAGGVVTGGVVTGGVGPPMTG